MINQEAEFDLNDGSEFLIKDAPDEILEAMAYSRQILYTRDVHRTG